LILTLEREIIPQPLLSSERLQSRIAELAAQLDRDYAGKDLVLVCILKGSYIFTADLTRNLRIPHEIDFMAVSSYREGTVSSGEVTLTKDLARDIRGRHVLLVEDIVDTGTTVRFLRRILAERGPASLAVVALLKKKLPDGLPAAAVEYVGFSVPPVFVVGYGLDYAERYRHLPYVGALEKAPSPETKRDR
jgi:hypoxanthine phosphoribosyltransferase